MKKYWILIISIGLVFLTNHYIFAQEIINSGNIENEIDIIQYDYLTTKIETEPLEIKRTENSIEYQLSDTIKKIKIYSGKPFYNKNGEWFNVETATTTLENFLQIQPILKSRIIKTTYADTIYVGSGDGVVYNSNNSWATIHALTTGTVNYTDIDYSTSTGYVNPTYYLYRVFMPFDTASLPDTGYTITSAILNFKTYNSVSTAYDYSLVQTSQASPTSLTSTDFDNITFTKGATNLSIGSTQTWYQWTLDSTGISWINLTGYTQLGIIGSHDFDNIAPTTNKYAQIQSAESTNDPYLEITLTLDEEPIPETIPSYTSICEITASTTQCYRPTQLYKNFFLEFLIIIGIFIIISIII